MTAPDYVLALDPGLRGCGVAVFGPRSITGDVLAWAAYVKGITDTKVKGLEAAVGMGRAVYRAVREALGYSIVPAVREIVVEWPQVYTRDKSEGDPNDLLGLSAVDGAVAIAFEREHDVGPAMRYVHYLPYQWKGQMPKDTDEKRVVYTRITTRLSPEEREIFDRADKAAGAKGHNMRDAVGIGLHHLGRFERRRVIAR